jgi:hypothetical protein
MKRELWQFSKNIQISKFIKIRPMAADLLHAGGYAWWNSHFSQTYERA